MSVGNHDCDSFWARGSREVIETELLAALRIAESTYERASDRDIKRQARARFVAALAEFTRFVTEGWV